MASNDPAVLDLVGQLYDCAIDPRLWPRALEQLARRVGGIANSISLQDPINRTTRLHATWNIPEGLNETHDKQFATLNPLITSGWFCEVDEPISAARWVGLDSFFNCRFHKEFTAPIGWYDAIGLHLAKSASRYGIMSLVGGPEKGIFSDHDLAEIRVFAPHIRRSLSISDLLDARGLHQDMLSATLDLLTVAIILCDVKGRIVYANRAGLGPVDSWDSQIS